MNDILHKGGGLFSELLRKNENNNYKEGGGLRALVTVQSHLTHIYNANLIVLVFFIKFL